MERSGPEGGVPGLVRQGRPRPGAGESAGFPRPHGRFAPGPAFEQVRPGPEAVRATTAGEIGDEPVGERFGVVCAPTAERLTPVTSDGRPASDVPVPVDGAGGWFRWSE
ncbi:hypothetical protein ABZY44_19425 [Streptomyces sp. NPDC006544]|uniref:hypothetical protein n=1 Tax=Streptomyces sp. NPDC006544 TaxID=3154583 RepID=UPI0033B55B27